MKFEGAAVAGIGMVPLRHPPGPQHPRAGPRRRAARAARRRHDAGRRRRGLRRYIQPASMIGVKAMKELGLTGLPVTHIENASATGLVAFREAAWAVASGRAEVAMAIGFDKMTDMMRGGPSRGTGRDQLDSTILPAAYFALWAQRRMHDHGTTAEHFATIAAKNWNHGALEPARQPPARPRGHRRRRCSRPAMVAAPLTAMMGCPPDDGAACVIVASTRGCGATSPTAASCARSPRRCRASRTRRATRSSARSWGRRR